MVAVLASPGTGSANGRRHSTTTAVITSTLLAFFLIELCVLAQPVVARLERQTYVAYRTPHLCSYQTMESVGCPEEKPMCCVASSAVRCCAGTTSCGNCTDDIVGYEMPRSSVILGCFSLSVFVLLGSIIMSGVGRHLAWVLERRRVIENYRKRLTLRRAEAREFKKELAETEEKDIPDNVACVICCARHIDVALTPCGHVCCCRFCAKRLRECPVCRAAVLRCFDLPLYYVKQLVKAATDDGEAGERPEDAESPASSAPAAASPTMEGGPEDAVAESAAAEVGTSGTHHRETADTEETTAAATTAHFSSFHSKKYTRLRSEDDEESAEERVGANVPVMATSMAAVRAASTSSLSAAASPAAGGRQGAALSAAAAPAAAPSSTAHPDGYIAVERWS